MIRSHVFFAKGDRRGAVARRRGGRRQRQTLRLASTEEWITVKGSVVILRHRREALGLPG